MYMYTLTHMLKHWLFLLRQPLQAIELLPTHGGAADELGLRQCAARLPAQLSACMSTSHARVTVVLFVLLAHAVFVDLLGLVQSVFGSDRAHLSHSPRVGLQTDK